MKLLRPKVMFVIPESVGLFEEAARLENITSKVITFGKYKNYESLDDIISSQTVEDVKNFKLHKIEDASSTPAVIIPTAGTTGIPKNVVHSHKGVFSNFMEFDVLPVKNSKVLGYMSSYWISDIAMFFKCVRYEATRIFHTKFDLTETVNIIDEYKVNKLNHFYILID